MRVRTVALLGVGSCLLTGFACPTSDPFPPPTLHAPAFTNIEIAGVKRGDGYTAEIHLQWTPPMDDSLPVHEYQIIRKRQFTDSVYVPLPYYGQGIPDSVRDDYDVLVAMDFPAQGDYEKIWYRMFAIDTMGRCGDTSAPDSIRLCWAPRPGYPVDTLRQNLFKWYAVHYLAGYFTYMFLWSDAAGLLWTSPMPKEPYYGHETADSFFVKLPDSLYPLPRGVYWYGAKVEFPGENIQTLAIQQFNAP